MTDKKLDTLGALDLSALWPASRAAQQFLDSSGFQQLDRLFDSRRAFLDSMPSRVFSDLNSFRAIQQPTLDAISPRMLNGMVESFRLITEPQPNPLLQVAARDLGAASTSLNQWFRGVTASGDAFGDVARWVQADRMMLSNLSTMANSLSVAAVSPPRFEDFQRTFAGDLLRGLNQVSTAPDEKALEQRLKAVEGTVRVLAERLPKGWLSREFVLSLAITIIVFVVQSQQGKDSERRLLEYLETMNDRFLAAANELSDPQEVPNPRVVRRAVRVRREPTTSSEILAVLQPGAFVEASDTNGGWLRVRYFDPVLGEIRDGWAVSRCLEPLHPSR